ncbi:MAG TPA: FAD-binding protein, partial [Burkholderiales bacterium]|nr:FAD-binding protein [Burkholderiales bacterium]
MHAAVQKPSVRAALLAELRSFLPEQSVLAESEELKPYECDGLSAYRQLPMLAVLPENEEQVQRVLLACNKYRVPVVARGAGTGLSGGALPIGDGVLLPLTKFMRILEIDPIARTMRVQPGVRNLAISEAAAPYGLYYAPDPGSQIACSIGGNVAENSGGVHCLKYGLTVHNILKLRVFNIEGEPLEIGSDALDSPGYDLLALMTGSEGMLGVITEITVKLLPLPERAQIVLAVFDDMGRAADAVANIITAGIIPAGLELMDKRMTQAVEPYANAGYPLDAEAILLCESDGCAEDVTEEIQRIL